MLRSEWFGKTAVASSGSPVFGLLVLPVANQRSIAERSYVCPSVANTGSVISSVVIGHTNASGGSGEDAGTGDLMLLSVSTGAIGSIASCACSLTLITDGASGESST